MCFLICCTKNYTPTKDSLNLILQCWLMLYQCRCCLSNEKCYPSVEVPDRTRNDVSSANVIMLVTPEDACSSGNVTSGNSNFVTVISKDLVSSYNESVCESLSSRIELVTSSSYTYSIFISSYFIDFSLLKKYHLL